MEEKKSRKTIFGMVKMGEKGQIVIPKEAREMFGFKPGDMLLIIGDESQGLAIPRKEAVAYFHDLLQSGVPPIYKEDEEEK